MRTGLRALALVALFSTLLPILGVRAQDAITLLPYQSPGGEFSSVVPEGWSDLGNGLFSPGGASAVVLAEQGAPVPPDDMMAALMPQLLLTEPPASTGAHQGAALAWTLYQVDVRLGNTTLVVDLALASQQHMTYLVLLQAPEAEAAALRESVFVPALDALTPLERQATPMPYAAEQVAFHNGAVELAGTLSLPDGPGPYPAVVLVSGSGPQDRDEYLGGGITIRPFELLANALTPAGIAVLRYDDRGVGASTGEFSTGDLHDFADDAEAAIAYLTTREDIDQDHIGLIGHSEGGAIAAILGARNTDLDFIVSLAGLGVSGEEVLLLQTRLMLEAEGATPEEVQAQVDLMTQIASLLDDPDQLEEAIYHAALAQFDALPQDQQEAIGDVDTYARTLAAQQSEQIQAPSVRALLEFDPAPDWARTTVPVLAIFGGKDKQVDATQNAAPLLGALTSGGNNDVTVVILPDANHLFQAAGSGAFSEYATLPPEFTPDLLPIIIDWITLHTDDYVPSSATPVPLPAATPESLPAATPLAAA
ncbi:MAG: alpha/beta hydrolase [Thermomicrobiales bacterium]|nr:alpha/beta hydrolase [Thermomicrobiales bacterium]